MSRWVGMMLVLSMLAGCAKEKSVVDKVVSVEASDARMNAAIAKARATVDTFIVALKSPQPNQDDFSIKMGFTEGPHTEHMWLGSVTYDGTLFHGQINNDPETVKSVKIGDKASVDPAKISDWMYIQDGKVVGGETIRALRETLSPAERAEFDKSIPFRLD